MVHSFPRIFLPPRLVPYPSIDASTLDVKRCILPEVIQYCFGRSLLSSSQTWQFVRVLSYGGHQSVHRPPALWMLACQCFDAWKAGRCRRTSSFFFFLFSTRILHNLCWAVQWKMTEQYLRCEGLFSSSFLFFFFPSFLFQKGLLSSKRVLQKNKENKSCRKPSNLQIRFCSILEHDTSKEATELAKEKKVQSFHEVQS